MTVLLTLLILLLVVGAMSIGVIMGRKPIKGSCGGLNAIGIDGECEICGGNPNKCESTENNTLENPALTVDASNQKGRK